MAWKHTSGYLRTRVNGKLEYVHRIVAQELLGRPLRAGETVHHLNGNRADNRPCNLEVWAKAQPTGIRLKDALSQAVELLLAHGYQVKSPPGM